LAEGASLLTHVVTSAERNDDRAPLNNDDLLPTRPFKNVVGDISQLYSSQSALVPFPALRKVSYFGFADSPGRVRRTMPLAVNVGGQVFPSFDLQVLLQYLGTDPDQVVIKLGQEITVPQSGGAPFHIPIDKKACLTINYRARIEDFEGMSYSQMLQGLLDKSTNQTSQFTKHLPPLKNNIVVVGVIFNGTDAGVTPLDDDAPLVITHLNTLNNILQRDFITTVSPWIWTPVYAVFLFVAGNLMLRVGIAPMIPMGFFCMILVAAVGFAALWFGNLQIPVFMPEVGILLLAGVVPTKRFFGEEREKQRVKRAMSAYLSEKVMNKVLAHPDNVKLGGVKQIITIMFCDIRGFTAYCDNRDSQEVLTVLNEYMEEMTQVVFKYDGTVDKYIGDCIMAFWNAPELQSDHAQRAVCCAMEMRYALANFKTKRAGKDVELFECGIGIHTGEALVGNMGSTLKLNYTAMGSTVNLGARLESLTKKLNERILISQDTRNLLEGDFPLTDRGEALVPGFANPIRVYAVGADQDISSALKVGRTIATQQEYTAEEVSKPIWEPAPLPEDADPNP
jgi:adenylate cyclase